MKEFEGKVAFVTGAASGIGFAIAKAFVARGMKVMMADIESEPLEKAVASLREDSDGVEGVVCNVADIEAVKDAANKTIEAFGKVHVVVNNAGVEGAGGVTGSNSIEDWKWVLDVNLMGVVYGCETFVPFIKKHGEGGYIINTASMAGQVGIGRLGAYCASKFAVVGYTESINEELSADNIGAAVLCPAWVNTQINKSLRNHPSEARQQSFRGKKNLNGKQDLAGEAIRSGMSPDTVAKWVLESMEKNALYIFTHPNWKSLIKSKTDRIMLAYDSVIQSPTVQSDSGALSMPVYLDGKAAS